MGKFAAASAAVQAGEPPMLDWQSQTPTDAGGEESAAVSQGAVACLAQQVVQVSVAVAAKIAESSEDEASKQIGKLLNEALSSTTTESSTHKIAETQASLEEIPFKRYTETAAVALKRGIPMDKYEVFIKERIAPRYNLPEKHRDELCDSTYCDLNHVSITEFAFRQEDEDKPPEGDELLNSFTFCRMVAFRREKADGSEVVDLGYCVFKIGFNFGDEKITKTIMGEHVESIPRQFLGLTLGYDAKTSHTSRTEEETRKVQLNLGRQTELRNYFRHKAVQALSQDALEKGETTEVMHSHSGMSPIKDAD